VAALTEANISIINVDNEMKGNKEFKALNPL
jgi:hypothetical protein